MLRFRKWLAKIQLVFLKDKFNYLSEKCYLTLKGNNLREYEHYRLARSQVEKRYLELKDKFSL